MSPELNDVSEFYADRIGSKEREIKRLRDYIDQLESSEKRISSEYSEQLRAKSAEMERLRRAFLGRAVAVKSPEAKEKKAENENELGKLRGYIAELENSEKKISSEYADQIEEKDRQVKRLVNLIRLKEDANRILSEKLDGKMRNERDYVERIKNAITRKEEFNREVIEKLTVELARKNEEAEHLRDAALRQGRLVKQLESEVVEYDKRQDSMEAFLREKDSVRQKLEANYAQQLKNKEYEIEHLSKDLRKQFDVKPAARGQEEIASLKIKLEAREAELSGLVQELASVKEQNRIALKRLDERQRLFVESENAYNRLINSLQLQQEKRVKELMRTNSQREVELKTEIEKLKAWQREKETLLAEKGNRIDETLLQFSEMSRKLLELKGSGSIEGSGAEAAGAKGQQEEIGKLLKEAEARISEAVRKEQEVARREELLVKEQDAINAELSILRNAGVEVEKEKDYLKSKIMRYGIPEKEAQIGQPSAFGVEAAPEETAGYAAETMPQDSGLPEAPAVQEAVEEIRGKSEALEILRRPAKAVAAEETLPQLPAETKAQAITAVKKPVFSHAKSRVKHLPRPPLRSIREKVERPKLKEELIRQSAKMDAFPEVGGYGEIHEISSIIGIGLQHGDSVEQIRSSLESSGYSRHNIEKAFRLVKKK